MRIQHLFDQQAIAITLQASDAGAGKHKNSVGAQSNAVQASAGIDLTTVADAAAKESIISALL